MKQNMIIWVFAALMALLPSSTMTAAAQKHRHTPRTTIVDDKAKQQAANDSAAAAQAAAQPDATVAYSDTTSTAEEEEDYQTSAYTRHYKVEMTDDEKFVERILDKIDDGAWIAVLITFMLFVLAPFTILFTILYFINRNRRDRIRLAEMALQHGQPIPGTEKVIYREAKHNYEHQPKSRGMAENQPSAYSFDDDLHKRGVKHLVIGAGLMVCCLLFWNNSFFAGVGFLVACFGGGQIYMARSSRQAIEEPTKAEKNNTTKPEMDEHQDNGAAKEAERETPNDLTIRQD